MSSTNASEDQRWMRRALQLAARGRGQVEPNPMVGCVIVDRRGLIAYGHHRRFGGPHAEIDALRRCRRSPHRSSVYVTLEPCCHHGKTPACTEALIAAGVSRVVVAMRDPFPQVAGRGLRQLRRAGIKVHVGTCRAKARALNRPYLKLRRNGRPWVILKWAQSLDGRIATHRGDSKWISSLAARREGHRLRGRVDAIVVGIETVLADDPVLTCRHVTPLRVAARVVLDGRLRLPLASRLVQTAGQIPVIVATTTAARHKRPRKLAALERAGCEVLSCGRRGERVGLADLLDELGRREMTNVLVEGGGRVLGSFFKQGLADEIIAFIAPKLIGDPRAPGPLELRGKEGIIDVRMHEPVEVRRVGPDIMHRLVICR